jgi:hypothetical protein
MGSQPYPCRRTRSRAFQISIRVSDPFPRCAVWTRTGSKPHDLVGFPWHEGVRLLEQGGCTSVAPSSLETLPLPPPLRAQVRYLSDRVNMFTKTGMHPERGQHSKAKAGTPDIILSSKKQQGYRFFPVDCCSSWHARRFSLTPFLVDHHPCAAQIDAKQ